MEMMKILRKISGIATPLKRVDKFAPSSLCQLNDVTRGDVA